MAIQLLALWAEDAMTLHKSPKQRVLRKYPKAISHEWADCWSIYTAPYEGQHLADGSTVQAAWASAARNIEKRKHGL